MKIYERDKKFGITRTYTVNPDMVISEPVRCKSGIYDPEHPNASSNGCVYEHVLVAEKILGRHLNKEETVHHIDGNKKNNDPDNLMIFATNGDHIAYHTGMQAWSNNNIWYTARKTEAKIFKTKSTNQ